MKKIISIMTLLPSICISTPMIMYHDVNTVDSEYSISKGNFIEHLEIIEKNGYKTLTVSEYTNMVKRGETVPDNAIIITFDDGRKSMLWVADKLASKKMSATMYVMSGTFEYTDYLTRDDLRTLSLNPGIEIGAHSVTHFTEWADRLDALNYRIVLAEMVESKADIEAITGVKVTSFAWPYGHVYVAAGKFAPNIGYDSLVEVSGTANAGTNPYKLNRVNISGSCSSEQLLKIIKTKRNIKC